MTEKVLYTKTVFSGKVLRVSRDAIQMETGAETIREIVHHPGGACIAAVSGDYDVYMVRQPRYAFHEKLLELPAGKLEAGEEPEIAARRELAEEVGLGARKWRPLHRVYPTVGYSDEVIYCYLARELYPHAEQPDFDEDITVEKMPLDVVLSMVMDGRIRDAKTAVCILKLARMRSEGML